MDFTNRPIDSIKEQLKLELGSFKADPSRAHAIIRELDEIDGNKPLNSG